MKKNKQGFILLETLVVSCFVIGTLIYMFVQFSTLKKSYNNSYKYNTVYDLYGASNVNKFIKNTSSNALINAVNSSTDEYVEIYSEGICNPSYLNTNNITYCNQLMTDLNIKLILVSKENLVKLKTKLTTNNPYNEELYQYIKKISIKNNNNYRIIIEYNDNTFANLETEY